MMEWGAHPGAREEEQPLFPTAPGRKDRKGDLAKHRILCLCFLTQHPQACSFHPCLTPGEEEEPLMEHVSKTHSAKTQATNLGSTSPLAALCLRELGDNICRLSRTLSTLSPHARVRGPGS